VNQALPELPFTFTDEAEIVGGQDDPLPNTSDNDTDRELDWVIQDRDKLVGFESKYGSVLTESQLEDELTKLRANADGRTVHLVAITHHATEPELVKQFTEEPVHWTSWSSIAHRVFRIDEASLPSEHRVSIRMLQNLFEVEEMDPFEGFDHRNKSQYRLFIRDIQPEVKTLELEHRGDLHNWTQDKSNPSGYAQILPKYISIPFVHKDRPPHNENGRPQSKRASVFVVIIDTETHQTYAGVVFGIKKIQSHREMLVEHGEELAADYASQGYELWIGRHSINHREIPVERTQALDEMKDWLSTTGKHVLADPEIDNTYRKVWFVKECVGPEPEQLFNSIVEILATEKKRYLTEDAILKTLTLADPNTV
jgi:hypothetical protein